MVWLTCHRTVIWLEWRFWVTALCIQFFSFKVWESGSALFPVICWKPPVFNPPSFSAYPSYEWCFKFQVSPNICQWFLFFVEYFKLRKQDESINNGLHSLNVLIWLWKRGKPWTWKYRNLQTWILLQIHFVDFFGKDFKKSKTDKRPSSHWDRKL